MPDRETFDGQNAGRTERRYSRDDVAVDLGVEPPIAADGDPHSDLDRRRVSLRWLSGTVLTGLAGAGLIGSAVYSALDYRGRFAEAPEYIARERGDAPAASINTAKGDRLVRPVDIVAARQTFRSPTTIRVGSTEIVKTRNFTRVATTMAMGSVGFAGDVPPFNPLKLLAGDPARAEPTPDGDVERADADVSFVVLDMGAQESASFDGADKNYVLSMDEIQAQVNEHLKSLLGADGKRNLPLPPQMMLMRTSRLASDRGALAYANVGEPGLSSAFRSIEVRMVPENVTVIPKAAGDDKDQTEKLLVVRRDERLDATLIAGGVKQDQARALAAAWSRNNQRLVREGQKVKLLLADIDGSGAKGVARLQIYTDESLEGTIAVNDTGAYVLVERTETPAPRKRAAPSDDEDDPGAMRLYNSFYETALKHQIPRPVIDDLVRIFANDVDLNRAVAGGDAFEVFYGEGEERDAQELLYASITVRGENFRYYRFPADRDGTVDYFDREGRTNKKFLIRKPINGGEQRSGFGWRRHPILAYSRMHTGVDWAAPVGTPIVAAGNGVIIKAKRESGYGNRIEIQHGNGYVTAYNHMVGFARGMSEGARVRQGQVIGYVGSTGLSTGPHLHYEVIVNGNFVDPLRVRLGRTRQLTPQQLDAFARERQRIDELIAKAPNATRVAGGAVN